MRKFWVWAAAAALLVQIPRGAAVELELSGKSAVLMDVATGTALYEHNAHEPLAPASVTKIMTMLLVMEAIDSGSLGWDDPVTASETAAAKGGSQIYLKAGEIMTVTDLLKSVAVSSANDAACALAEHLRGSEGAFVEAMNEKARALGMEDTHFVNCTGLDDSPEAAQHKTSAWDIALMSRELLKNHPDIRKFTTIWMDTIRDGAFGLSNTNKLIRFYPGATGLKTGFTSGAGYCLSATASRDGMELIAVVMGSDSAQNRNASCKALLDYGFAGFALVQPVPEAEPRVTVKLGAEASVRAVPEETAALLIEKAKKNTVSTRLELLPEISAPVEQGQKLGTMTVLAGEEVLAQIPLVAAQPVARLGWGNIWGMVLRRIAFGK